MNSWRVNPKNSREVISDFGSVCITVLPKSAKIAATALDGLELAKAVRMEFLQRNENDEDEQRLLDMAIALIDKAEGRT